MNIFYLDESPYWAAQYHCDIHINKMIIESLQMLSTAIRYKHDCRGLWVKIPDKPKAKHLYKAPGDVIIDGYLVEHRFMLNTHLNHPCNVWVRQSLANMQWLHSLVIHLGHIYEQKAGKRHNSLERLNLVTEDYDQLDYEFETLTPPHRAMPILYWRKDIVESYRAYYKAKLDEWSCTPGKEHYGAYTNRDVPPPSWLRS